MHTRLKQRSWIGRRVFRALLITLLLCVAGLAGLLWYAYDSVRAIALTPLNEPAWRAAQEALSARTPELVAAAVIMLLLILLLAWVLLRVALQPLLQLVEATSAASDASIVPALPVRAEGEIGQLAQYMSALAQSVARSSQEIEHRDLAVNLSAQRLAGVLQVGQELNATLGVEHMLYRVVTGLRATFGYQCAGVALVEGETLAYYVHGETAVNFTPLIREPLDRTRIAGVVALTGSPLRIDNFAHNQRYQPSPGMPDARSELAAPIIYDRQMLAVLVLQSREAHAFSRQDEEQITALSSMLAVALANSRRLQVERLRRQLAEAIHRVSQTLNAAMTTEQVPELILDQLAQVLSYDRSALLLIDNEYVETMAARGLLNGQLLTRTRAALRDTPLIAEIASEGRSIILADAQSDQRYRPTSGAAPARSWLGAPLIRQDRVVGVLMLESDQPERYGEEELYAVNAIANQATIALENAQLYAEAQERAQRLEIITHITQVISTRDASRELPGILRTIIHLIRRVVSCDYAALALYHEEDDTFFVETVYDYAVRNWSDLPAGRRIPAAQTVWQTACRTAGPVVQSDLERSAFAEDRRLAANGLRSGVVVPIIGSNRAIGALNFASRQQDAYRQLQVATLLELSHYLGPALHNARLNQEREEASVKLARTQEHLNLVDKVRVVGQLASGVAHDFNNLLAGILGNAQLLLLEVQDEEQRSMLRVIERAARDGTETVRRLQGFARMEHDSPMTEVRLDMLVRDAIDITRPRWRDVAQSRGASIEIVRNFNQVTPIAGRPAELREVLTNMIINAVDAMPKGGQITMSVYDEKQADDSVSSVVVEIEDNGIGMQPEVRARIFDPFFTTKGEQGTGLGLAVSLGIVESHGGEIDVTSQAGQGTRFTIRLPVRDAQLVDEKRRYREAPIIPGHVLFIESDEVVREATVRLLTRWGHKVTQASGGVEALRMFAPDMYDVVISDLGMPDMSGWDVLGQIKQRDPNVPTVLITGWGRQFGDEESRARGVDFLIEKPFDQDDLREALVEAMAEE
jgi:signal transduction histidine kinase/HAMP domain-containing protein